ncbi:MAG: type II toxin-antitoxin system VapC family toxin [Pyrinomonadaceae bacterium]
MQVLLDTHTFMWYIVGNSRLSRAAARLIESSDTDAALSIVSLWEISIKNSLGRLETEDGYNSIAHNLVKYSITVIPIGFAYTSRNNRLPFHHKDPFDRMIATQALVEQIDLISVDDVFDRYFETSEVKRIW